MSWTEPSSAIVLLKDVWQILDNGAAVSSDADVLFDVLDLLRLRLRATTVSLQRQPTGSRPSPLLTSSETGRTATSWDIAHDEPASSDDSGGVAAAIMVTGRQDGSAPSSLDRMAIDLISSKIDDWLSSREAAHQIIENEELFGSLVDIHRQLISAPDHEVFATINDALERLAAFAGAEYATLTRVSADDLTMTPVAFWTADGRAPQPATVDHSMFEILRSMDDLVEVKGEALANGFRLSGVPAGGTLLTTAVRTTRSLTEHQLTVARSESSPWTESERVFMRALSGHLGQALSRISSQQLFRLAFDSAPTGLTIRNQQFELVACNRAYEKFVHTSEDQLIGSTPDTVGVKTDHLPTQPGVTEEQEVLYHFAGDHHAWASVRQTSIQTADGGALYLNHVEDVTERKRAQSTLVHQATHDALTGLGNRRLLGSHLDDLFVSGTPCGILLLDLDRFKLVNDSLGHDVGDDLLITVADRIRTAVRPNDVVARLGGDEFAVLMPGGVSELETSALAERLLAVIATPILLSGQQVFPEASLGAAISTGHDQSPDTLIRQADTAMYEAKDAGRNRMAIFTPEMDQRVQYRLRLESELRTAIDNDEFVLHFQPEINLISGLMIGAEALIRWEHPDGLRMPDEFIGRAEESGRIVDIGQWVAEAACAQMARWLTIDGTPQQVRVNLSAVQLALESIVDDVTATMEAAGIEPRHLCLEITESALMDDVDLSLQRLTRLKDLGITLAIDDFGTGFSSLAYLQRFPVDVLKIDRSFVSRLCPTQPSSIALVESVISLAHAFDLDVVAEGIETESQAATLIELGCHRGQGYLYSEAVPASELSLNTVASSRHSPLR